MPFQRYRVLLVDTVDHLLEILKERADYTSFMLDGQTVVVEDYLEVRPEKRPELAGLIQSQRLELGPWYVLPDEFIPSPESLIRNLLLGRKQMQQLQAPPARVGYLPDTFGHPAQLPQILAGFDLDSMVIFRGVQADTSEFIWEAPDGTGLLTIYLPGGYYNAMELARAPRYWLKEQLLNTLERLARFATTDVVLLMNGSDHLEAQPATQEFIELANQLQAKVHLRQGRLNEYVELVRQSGAEFAVKRGEWRHNRPARITPGVLSARMYLKQADFRAAIQLERGAEPLQALNWALGGQHDTGLLGTAWRYLLQNHPHDSICGCSLDEVHRDCETRFRWAHEIGGDLVERAASALAHNITMAKATRPPVYEIPAAASPVPGFTLFNTLATPRTEIIRQRLHFLEPGQTFALVDQNGHPVPYQELKRTPMKLYWDPQRLHFHCEGRTHPALVVFPPSPQNFEQRWQRWQGEEVELLFQADLPAGGYTILKAVSQPAQTPTPETTLRCSESSLENELVRVEVATDGSFSLLDKTGGRRYGPLNVFRSEADRGDEYSFCPVVGDKPVLSLNGSSTVKLVEAGPLRGTLEIRLSLKVPARLAEDRTGRVAELVELPVVSYVSLSPGRRRVEIRTELNNTACDHRLRALFASGVKTKWADVQGQFQVMRRLVELPEAERLRVPEFDEEQEVSYHPQRAFVDVSDERGGLGVLNRGLPEYEAEPSDKGVWLGITLLRGVGWLSRDDLSTRYKHAGPALETPEAQCPGPHRFEYAVVPHRGDWLKGGIAREAESYITPVYSAALNLPEASAQDVALAASFYRLEPAELLFSACKRSEDGRALLLRAYNAASYPLEAALKLGFSGTVHRANLAERELEALENDGNGAYYFPVRPYEIVTFSIRDIAQ
jgi:alpha-mannosidase